MKKSPSQSVPELGDDSLDLGVDLLGGLPSKLLDDLLLRVVIQHRFCFLLELDQSRTDGLLQAQILLLRRKREKKREGRAGDLGVIRSLGELLAGDIVNSRLLGRTELEVVDPATWHVHPAV